MSVLCDPRVPNTSSRAALFEDLIHQTWRQDQRIPQHLLPAHTLRNPINPNLQPLEDPHQRHMTIQECKRGWWGSD